MSGVMNDRMTLIAKESNLQKRKIRALTGLLTINGGFGYITCAINSTPERGKKRRERKKGGLKLNIRKYLTQKIGVGPQQKRRRLPKTENSRRGWETAGHPFNREKGRHRRFTRGRETCKRKQVGRGGLTAIVDGAQNHPIRSPR